MVQFLVFFGITGSQSVYYAIGSAYQLARHVIKNPTMEQVKQKPKKNGFTLIELLMTLAVALIIGSIAIPGYQHSVRKGRRHIVQNQMLSLHLQQQHFYLSNQKYASEKDLTIDTSQFYVISVQQDSEDDFIIVAEALAPQQSGSGCNTMTINHNLIKTPKACW